MSGFSSSVEFNTVTSLSAATLVDLVKCFNIAQYYTNLPSVGPDVPLFTFPVTINLTGRSYGVLRVLANYSHVNLVGLPPVFINQTNVVSVSGSGTSRTAILQLDPFTSADDIQIGDWLVPDLRPDGPNSGQPTNCFVDGGSAVNLHSIAGKWQITAVDDTNNRVTVAFNAPTQIPSPSGDIQVNWAVVKTTFTTIAASRTGQIGGITNVHATNVSTKGATAKLEFFPPCGLESVLPWDLGSIVASNCTLRKVNVNYGGFLRADAGVIQSDASTGIDFYMENAANATVEGCWWNGVSIGIYNKSFLAMFDATIANKATGSSVVAEGGSTISLEETLVVLANMAANPYSPSLNTLSADGSYINGVAPPN